MCVRLKLPGHKKKSREKTGFNQDRKKSVECKCLSFDFFPGRDEKTFIVFPSKRYGIKLTRAEDASRPIRKKEREIESGRGFVHVCVRARVRACVGACVRSFVRVYLRAYVRARPYVRACVPACLRACVRPCVRACVSLCFAWMHTLVRACSCASVHACLPACECACMCNLYNYTCSDS